jgi:Holliday junction DNA helicase RuvA
VYDFLSGRLASKSPTQAVIDVNGVGYKVDIPLSTYEKLPREGQVKLLVWLRVSDDDLRLFGFATERERSLFLRLVDGVQQLGPAKAIQILSSATFEQLTKAIESGDVAFLKGIKGVGEKLANRLVVELRGKLPADAGKEAEDSSISRDAVSALVSLGYERKQAEEAVRRVLKDAKAAPPVEELIRRSLAHV